MIIIIALSRVSGIPRHWATGISGIIGCDRLDDGSEEERGRELMELKTGRLEEWRMAQELADEDVWLPIIGGCAGHDWADRMIQALIGLHRDPNLHHVPNDVYR